LRHKLSSVLLPALAVFLLGCGTPDSTGADSSSTTVTTLVVTTSSTTATTTTTIPPTTSTTSAEITTTTASSGLPGDPIVFGPSAGDVVAVVGVAHDDVLNLRAAPGANQEIVDRIPPHFSDLLALGRTRQLSASMWIAVDYEGAEGWVNLRYTGYLGKTTDTTAQFVDGLSASSMVELGMTVAEASGFDRLNVVVSSAPTQSDPGEITLDLLGLEDDSVRGARLRVTGRQTGAGFTLDTVETTPICGRGVDGDGVCI